MKKTLISLVAVTVLSISFILPTIACSGCSGKKPPAAQKKVVSAVCPVMGNKIPDVTKATSKSVYKGKTYYFCCKGCKPKFDKDPQKYIKNPKK